MSVLRDVGLYVPVRDGARALAGCLAAISALDPAPAEVLVVDDGSRDDSARIAHQAGVGLLSLRPGRGLAAARNAGWRTLTQPLVASLDADCAPAPDWLGRLHAALATEPPEVGGVGGRLLERGARPADRWRRQWLAQDWGLRPRDVPFLFGANGLLRREALETVGGYDERYTHNAEDYWLGRSLGDRGYRMRHVPAARVLHLRRDRSAGVLRNCWRHRFYGHRLPVGWGECMRSVIVQLRSAASMFRQDLLAGRHQLLLLDLAFGPMAAWRDLEATWQATR